MSPSVRYFERDECFSGDQCRRFRIRILFNRQIECCDVKVEEEESIRAIEVELEVNRTAQ